MRRAFVAAVVLASAVSAAVSSLAEAAGTQPTLTYQPPLIQIGGDQAQEASEDVVIRQDGSDFTFTNPAGFMPDAASEAGCTTIANGYSCPREGVTKIFVRLGKSDDSADIDLGKVAESVRQVLKGGPGDDRLLGGAGPQKLKGGAADDEVIGGQGGDYLLGGSGIDVCRGGSGRDIIHASCD